MLEVNYESDNIKVTGVIGNTMISRDNRKEQILFLNKRNIKNKKYIVREYSEEFLTGLYANLDTNLL